MPSKKLLLFGLVLFLCIAVPASASSLADEDDVGNSRWAFSKDAIRGSIVLNSFVFPLIKPIADGHYNLASPSDEQLQQLATRVIQPYIDKKLSITVNGKTCPIKVSKVEKGDNGIFTIWLSADHVGFNKPVNDVRVVYSLLFEETKDLHVNLAFGYVSGATADALQHVFDVSHPQFQTRFNSLNRDWQVSLEGAAIAHTAEQKSGPEMKSSN